MSAEPIKHPPLALVDEPRPDELPGGLAYADAWSEAEASADRHWRNATDDERIRLTTAAAVGRRQQRERLDELGFASMEDYLAAMADIGPAPPNDVELVGEYLQPEDRGTSTLSPLGDLEYVEDLMRPGRIVAVAAEEGTGKTTRSLASWASVSPSLAARSRALGQSCAPVLSSFSRRCTPTTTSVARRRSCPRSIDRGRTCPDATSACHS